MAESSTRRRSPLTVLETGIAAQACGGRSFLVRLSSTLADSVPARLRYLALIDFTPSPAVRINGTLPEFGIGYHWPSVGCTSPSIHISSTEGPRLEETSRKTLSSWDAASAKERIGKDGVS